MLQMYFRKNRGSIAIKWFVSYLVVFLVPLVAFLLISVQLMHSLVSEIKYYNSLTARQVRLYYDGLFEQVSSLAERLSQDKKIEAVLSIPDNKALHPYACYEATTAISNASERNDVAELFIYCPGLDLVLGPTSYGSASLFYRSYYADSSLSYEEFVSLISAKRTSPVFRDILLQGNEKLDMVMVRPLRLFLRGQQYANLVLVLNKTTENSFSDSHIALFDLWSKDTLYSDIPLPFSFEQLTAGYEAQKGEGSFTLRREGREYQCSAVPSALHGWLYLVYADAAVSLRNARIMQKLIVVASIILSVVGFFLLSFLTRASYRRVGKVMEKIDDSPFSGKGDELVYIGSAIDRIQNEKKCQREELRGQYLDLLLDGADLRLIPDKKAFEHVGLLFPHRYFMMLSVSNFLRRDAIIPFLEGKDAVCYPLTRSDKSILLVNIADEALLYAALVDVDDAIVSVSQTAMSYRMVHQLYLEVQDVDAYRQWGTLPPVASYADLTAATKNKAVHYDVDDELGLLDALRKGDGDEAIKSMEHAYRANLDAGISPQSLRYLLLHIAATIIKVVSCSAELYPGLSFQPILGSMDIPGTFRSLEDAVRHYCISSVRKIESREQAQEFELYQSVVDYIDSHVEDKNLSVASVAEELTLTPLGLSRLFKKMSGTLISDYIAGKRVLLAKEILRSSDVSLSSCAEMCGFGSLRTFMRVFKDQVKMTPGHFKDYVAGAKDA